MVIFDIPIGAIVATVFTVLTAIFLTLLPWLLRRDSALPRGSWWWYALLVVIYSAGASVLFILLTP